MDIWLMAATAATGYIAKQLQNITKGKDNFLESSSEENVKPESPRRCLLSRLGNERKFGDDKMKSDGGSPDAHRVDVPSTSGENSGNCEDVHPDSLFCLIPEFPEIEHGNWKTSGTLAGDTELSSSFRQRRFARRNQQYRRLTKPLSSLESCLMSRFHGEQIAVEDCMTSPFPSPHASISRPLLVTDGARVISKSTADSLWLSQQIILSEDKAARNCGISGFESSVERKVGNEKTKSRKHGLIEMEPGFEVEFAQGELRADPVKGNRLDETESNQDPSGNSTPESGNYAVSPRELSLRLHNVINSRLEKRITELEAALQESQRKVEQLVMESESKKNSWSRLWETREVVTYE